MDFLSVVINIRINDEVVDEVLVLKVVSGVKKVEMEFVDLVVKLKI